MPGSVRSSHAGSWRKFPDGRYGGWRRAWLLPARKGLDDDHVPAAMWARRAVIFWLIGDLIFWRWRDLQQFAGERDIGLVRGTSEQAVMADTVEAGWQDMEQEPADELVGGQRHDLLAVGAVSTIVFVAEDDILAIEPDQATVRYGDAVSVAREIGEHRFGSGEGRLGVDHPALLAHW